jgi:pimeloyl-ACP methyl ester carboxylesterase
MIGTLNWRILMGLVAIWAGACSAGCSQVAPDRDVRMTRGYVYYLDGAGGGGLMNWSGGVREGLVAAGYAGAGEMFRWQTGLGVVADQTSSKSYKWEKARKLAAEIRAYKSAHPAAPVTLIGLSAGTAVAALALEALPPDTQVANVVLLSGSLSADHDLTKALQRVAGRMYVTTSKRDAVLGFLVPISGTADRSSRPADVIGNQGPRMPANATPETRRQYAKVVEVPWTPRFEQYGDNGGHLDTVKARFVEAVVAPLVLTTTARFGATKAETAGGVPNPDYARWAGFAVGSYVVLEGQQEVDGVREPLRMRATLVAKDADRLIVERVFEPLGASKSQPPLSRRFYVAATIKPAEHPLTHPQAKVRDLAAEEIDVGAQPRMPGPRDPDGGQFRGVGFGFPGDRVQPPRDSWRHL